MGNYIVHHGRGYAGLIEIGGHLVKLRGLRFGRLHPQKDFIGIDGDGGEPGPADFGPEDYPGANRGVRTALPGNDLKIAQTVLNGNDQSPGGHQGLDLPAGCFGVKRLDAQEDDIVRLVRVLGRNSNRSRLQRAPDAVNGQALPAQDVKMFTPADEIHTLPGLLEQAAENGAQSTGSHN